MVARVAAGVAIALLLGACATEQGPAPPPPPPQSDMTGRWMLSAPNAPPCGMEFEGAPGQMQGMLVPDGGCPGHLYLSRRWTFVQDTLTIADKDGQPLATLKLSDAQFTGQSAAGTPLTLSR
jgi:hypothetical protein